MMRSSKTKSPMDVKLVSNVNNSEIEEDTETIEDEAMTQAGISRSEIRRQHGFV